MELSDLLIFRTVAREGGINQEAADNAHPEGDEDDSPDK